MRVLLLNPPRGYAFMPYLALPLIKGYVESMGNHNVDQEDINLDYYRFLWSAEAQQVIQNLLENCSQNIEATYYHTLATYMERQVEVSYHSLKEYDTYKSRTTVRFHNYILNSVDRLIEAVDRLNSVNVLKQPNNFEQMDEILNNFKGCFLGRWLTSRIGDYKLENYDIVGISITYGEQFIPSLFIAKLIRESYPFIKITIGGNLTSHFKREILQDKSIWRLLDYCIFNEGEHLLLELLNSLEMASSKEVENIAYFSSGKVKYKENFNLRPKIQAIPDFNGLKLNLYPTPAPVIPILSSKGCYWGKCAYCSHYEGYGQGYYPFDCDHVVKTIQELKNKYGAQYFYFVDEAIPPKTIHAIAKRLKEKKENIRWLSEARIEKYFLSIECLQDLKDSGCSFLIHGIETGNQEISNKMLKSIDLNDTIKHLRNCKEVGIGTAGMFFIGFPGETYEQAEDTFKFIEENRNCLDFATVGVFTLERGTHIYLKPSAYGIEEIINADKEYQDSPDYKLIGVNQISNYKSRYEMLKELYSRYKHLNSVFTSESNRALTMFLKEYENHDENTGYDLSNKSISIPVVIRHGPYKGSNGLLNLYEKQLKVLK